ncbi:MAG: nucleotide exchange factor GrpE [Halobacteriovoraceae bacterium]|nr:nucleotide exchange factor GrpE [Halobacteriovoraceae bacterium]
MTDVNVESENPKSSEDAVSEENLDQGVDVKDDSSGQSEEENVVNLNADKAEPESKSELEELEKERDSFKEKYYYIAAELENTRKRFEREKTNLVKFGNEKLISSLVGALDNLDLTLMAVAQEEDEKVKNICVGVQMVRDQFFETLKQNGLEVIETEGKDFDPKFHEAISQKEEDGVEPGKVIQEVQKGYVLNGRVVRASKVITSK